ncbi:MAG TPA: alpha/beta hydrolase [Vicinamibacteria bacterium]|nr:alpha/beta hydrolase [Vicinamibacteria bacterium]
MTRLVLLPGLGADARLFDALTRSVPSLEVPRWVTPLEHESLASFGRRMASSLGAGEDLCVGGVSFGGMVAIEMARHLPVRGVLLIGSCSSPDELPTYARFLERALRIVPSRVYKAPAKLRPLFGRKFGCNTPQQEDLLFEMLLDTPVSFLKWGCRAILEWKPDAPPAAPVWRIHGASDRLIPASRVRADRLVEGAGHLVSLTHPDEVAGFIRERCQ